MNQLFKDTSKHKWMQNVVSGGKFTNEYSYIIGYWEAGNILVEKALTLQTPEKGHLFYPICYLYRQFVELTTKQLIIKTEKLYIKAASLEFQQKILSSYHSERLKDTHSLEKLLDILIDTLESVADEQFDKEIKKLIIEYHNIDPDGQKFRYPISTKNQISFPNQKSIDLVELKNGIKSIASYFNGINAYIDHYDSAADEIINLMNSNYVPPPEIK